MNATDTGAIAWVEVVGRDGKRVRSFYSELFNWTTADIAPGANYGVMDAAKHGLGSGIGTSQDGGSGHMTFVVEVDDLEATLRNPPSGWTRRSKEALHGEQTASGSQGRVPRRVG
jgi:predicted enzyme related to lactoylglutathione lyase